MYSRLILKTGCTLQQLRDDLVGLLTGTITAPSALSSADTSTSEIVTVLAPEWTFVQHLADTATRCHFVLSGVDDGGLPKTLGVIMTDTSGTLGMVTWVCGEWDSVNRRPAAIDVTGWHLASAYLTASEVAAGGAKNGIIIHSTGGNPHAIGVYNTGAMQLQVTSEQGVTGIYTHYSTTHHVLVEVVDVDRSVWSEWGVSKWPFTLINCSSTFTSLSNSLSGLTVSGIVTSAGEVGLYYGPYAWQNATAPLSAEIGTTKVWYSNASPAGYNSTTDYRHPNSLGVVQWFPDKAGVKTYAPRQNALVYQGSPSGSGPTPYIPVPHRINGQITPLGTTGVQTINYPDELAANGDTYVGTGTPRCCVYKG